MLRSTVEALLPAYRPRATARASVLHLKDLHEDPHKPQLTPARQEERSGSMWKEAMRKRTYLLERSSQAGEGAGGRRQRSPDWLYESYYCMSQQHPLIVFLLLIVMSACLALLAVFFASGLDIEDHVAFVITVPSALAIFLTIFVLVCIESIFKKLLRVFSLVIWACLVAMGYLFMFFGGIICPWDQKTRHMLIVMAMAKFKTDGGFHLP
ncbi:putative adenylate cyclase type 2 [Triplophysa rosa]|uniref:Adenylate cyclase type 2 n=1 Tax=Triplophysa rosa TaxID=992332 RepID=A0A9W7WRF1_TRIRA|nr:putative adenylate cyclase type 2 [Triplophysa rosa]